jgi:NADH-quinone oxidoreductase subunit C
MVELSVLQQKFGVSLTESFFRENRRVDVPAAVLFDLLSCLKNEHGFNMLMDMTAVDYLEYEGAVDRFGVVYMLLNVFSGERLIVRTAVNLPDPKLPSVYSLWRTCDWMEREVFDMFGIEFEGHPDLRRLLMPEEFLAFPLRKDYPLKGRGERHNFPVITRSGS